MTGPQISRAVLSGADGAEVHCKFNPESMQRTKSVGMGQHPARGNPKQPRPQFVGVGQETLTVRLLFDGFDTLGSSDAEPVDDAIETLFGWLTVPPSAQSNATPQPPSVTFSWGSGFDFDGTLQKVDVQYVMFNPSGLPVRAYATVTLVALPDTPGPTNPTSGGIPGRTSAQLREGDTLASISYAQYGDPNLWRAIAVANGIDDPARVAIGTRLLVPPRTVAEALSAPAPVNGSGDG